MVSAVRKLLAPMLRAGWSSSGRRCAEAWLAVVAECGAPLMLGFNRRFDPNEPRPEPC